jgi:hypothetical protein
VSSDRWTLAEERDVRSLVVPKVGSFERLDDPLEVDEIGPSLRYATAKVNKVSRDSGSSGGTNGAGAPADDPWGSAPPTGDGGGFADEPPF